MRDHGRAGVAVAAHDVEHARREELGGDLGHQRGGHRRGVAGLEHDAVAGGERRRELPDRHHHRVVPRRHLADDADRLAPDVGREAGHVLARRCGPRAARAAPAKKRIWSTRRRDLLGAGQLDRLAGVLALGGDDVLGAVLHRVGELQQRPLPLARASCRARSRTPWPRRA